MLSHVHRTIFVHIPKCAGSSVERMFLDELGLDWNQRAPLLLRPRVDREPGPPSLTHLTAADYVNCRHISESLFDEYFKFAIVRSPIARVQSTYKYIGAAHIMSFDRFVNEQIVPGATNPDHRLHWFFRPQSDFLLRDGCIAVDAVAKLEDLTETFPSIALRAGLASTTLPHENRSATNPTGSVVRSAARAAVRFGMRPGLDRGLESASNGAIKVISEVFATDFELLGYSIP